MPAPTTPSANSGANWGVSRTACPPGTRPPPTAPAGPPRTGTVATASTRDRAEPAPQQQQEREDDVQLGLDGDRPERAVRGRRHGKVLQQQPVHGTDWAVGATECGWGATVQATTRLNASAAQYGGRIRQARRRANRLAPPPSRQPLPAGPTASEKPDTTRKNTTARWPYRSQPTQGAARGWSGSRGTSAPSSGTAARTAHASPRSPSSPARRPRSGARTGVWSSTRVTSPDYGADGEKVPTVRRRAGYGSDRSVPGAGTVGTPERGGRPSRASGS